MTAAFLELRAAEKYYLHASSYVSPPEQTRTLDYKYHDTVEDALLAPITRVALPYHLSIDPTRPQPRLGAYADTVACRGTAGVRMARVSDANRCALAEPAAATAGDARPRIRRALPANGFIAKAAV